MDIICIVEMDWWGFRWGSGPFAGLMRPIGKICHGNRFCALYDGVQMGDLVNFISIFYMVGRPRVRRFFVSVGDSYKFTIRA